MSDQPTKKSARQHRLEQRTEQAELQVVELKRKKKAQWLLKRKEASKKQDVVRMKKREAARRRREAIKLDPKLHEESKRKERERWHKRRAEGKVRTVAEMNERERRKIRRKNREYFQTYVHKKRKLESSASEVNGKSCCNSSVQFVTPESSQNSLQQLQPTTRQNSARKAAGRKKMYRYNSVLYRRIEKLNKENVSVKKSLWRARKVLQKIRNKTELTPRSKVRKLVKGKNINPAVRKKLVFGEVCHTQIKKALSLKSLKAKQVAYIIFSGSLMKHYRVQNKCSLSARMIRKYGNSKTDVLQPQRAERSHKRSSIKQVYDFFMSDDNSIECADKNAFVYKFGKNKLKRRRRYLRGTLKDLYSSYCQKVEKPLSYSKFCAFKPFNVVPKDLKERDTCLCTTCENMELLLSALHRSKAIPFHSNIGLLRSLFCSPRTDDCYQRKCNKCKENNIKFLASDDEDVAKFQKWVSVTEKKIISKRTTGKNQNGSKTTCAEIEVKRTVKNHFQKSLKELKEDLLANSEKYFKHVFRDTHQTRVLKQKRENLGPGELYVWVDFAANYICKYDRETQRHYYGASHAQVVMHTGVAHTQNEKQAFTTVTESSRKDPSAILAHLTPVLKKFLKPEITKLHLQSDSPGTQYRNKTMFFLATRQIPVMFPQLNTVTYNYTEAGHGKGACDGVGARCKNAADEAVKTGDDVPDYHSFVKVLKKKCTTMFIDTIDNSQIEEIDCIIPSSLETFKGTMEVHQFSWSRESRNLVHFNEVSCYSCELGKMCTHFKLKNSPWFLPEPNLEDSSDEDEPLSRMIPRARNAESGRTAKTARMELESIQRGDWVAVIYGKHWYPGLVTKLSHNMLTVNFMVKHQKRDDLFLWPPDEDIQPVKKEDILWKLKEHPRLVDRSHFSVPERDFISNLMAK